MSKTTKTLLRVGTDCSGMEAPIMALRQLKIPFSHEFSSEIDKHCLSTIKANYHPKTIYGDMKKRDIKSLPDIDLYICGFPCQPFSAAGKREGVFDPRGTIFWECLKVIKTKKPKVFILENVKGLLSIQNGETFKDMLRELEKIKGYVIKWKVLNTADYGIPQNRKRVFIVGIRGKKKDKFDWPEKIDCDALENYIDWKDKTSTLLDRSPIQKRMIQQLPKNAKFADLSFTFHHYPNSHIICPTLVARNSLWNVPCKRFANVNEFLKLQGFPLDFKQVVSDRQLKKQIGNSMSVNVLMAIFKKMFESGVLETGRDKTYRPPSF